MSVTGLQKFKLGKLLGSGGFASVYIATDQNNQEKYAMKILEKERCKGQERHIVNEVKILKSIEHEHIIRLFDVYETPKKIYLQMEYMPGGELLERIIDIGHYTENDAKKIVQNICEALDFLHDRNIVHRDLKPENLLLKKNDDLTQIKIADFGLAKVTKSPQTLLSTNCGTLSYMPPEVLASKEYTGPPSDMWALGVIAYILLSGYPPFYSEDDQEVIQLTLNCHYTFPDKDWNMISKEAKEFIRNLVQLDPEKRLSAKEALKHKWISGKDDRRENLHGSVSENIKKHFNAKKKLKMAIDAVLFTTKGTKAHDSELELPVDDVIKSANH